MTKKSLLKDLKYLIKAGRKLAKQIDRKLASMTEINKAKTHVKNELIKLCK